MGIERGYLGGAWGADASALNGIAAAYLAVTRNPDDRGLREAWRDRLYEDGDAWAEVVDFGLRDSKGALTEKEQETYVLHVRALRDAFLGPAAAVAGTPLFSGGTLDVAELPNRFVENDPSLEVAIDDPRLWTLRRYHAEGHAPEVYGRIVCAPGMRRLEEISAPTREVFDSIARAGRDLPFREIEMMFEPSSEDLDRLGELPNLPRLERIGFTLQSGDDKRSGGIPIDVVVRLLSRWPGRSRYRGFCFRNAHARDVGSWWDTLETLDLPSITARWGRDDELTVRRTPDGVVLEGFVASPRVIERQIPRVGLKHARLVDLQLRRDRTTGTLAPNAADLVRSAVLASVETEYLVIGDAPR